MTTHHVPDISFAGLDIVILYMGKWGKLGGIKSYAFITFAQLFTNFL